MAKKQGNGGVRFLERYLIDEQGTRWELAGRLDTRAEIERLLTAGAGLLLHAVHGPVCRATTPRQAEMWWRKHGTEILEGDETADIEHPTWVPELYKNGASKLIVLSSWCLAPELIEFD